MGTRNASITKLNRLARKLALATLISDGKYNQQLDQCKSLMLLEFALLWANTEPSRQFPMGRGVLIKGNKCAFTDFEIAEQPKWIGVGAWAETFCYDAEMEYHWCCSFFDEHHEAACYTLNTPESAQKLIQECELRLSESGA